MEVANIIFFQNTYTNAEKLLAAAEELAQTGECNADDIYSVARELESHISSFARRVEQRRHVLELAVLFYSHVEEVIDSLHHGLTDSIKSQIGHILSDYQV